MTTTTATSKVELEVQAYAALQAADGSATEAAKVLGVPRTTVIGRAKRHEARLAQVAAEGETVQEEAPQTGEAVSPFVADPANPTDEELAAAIQRGLDNGTMIDADVWLAQQEAADASEVIEPEDEAGEPEAETADEPAEVKAPKAKGTYKPKPADKQCACGCGELTARVFARGHDSRFASKLRAAYKAGEMTREQVIEAAGKVSERFHGKLVKSLAQADEESRPGTGTCPCCGEAASRTFVRGHDSRYAKKLTAGYVAGEMTREQVAKTAAAISDRFAGKVAKALDRADAKRAASEAA
jgi:hypothetical protein